jgi:hypothetical protein
MRKIIFSFIWVLCVLFVSSCVSPSRSQVSRTIEDFRIITFQELSVLVEEKTRESEFWTYFGKDERYHYFVRMPGRKLFGGRRYLYVKIDIDSINLGDDSYFFTGRPQVKAFVFSKRINGKFEHSIEYGLIDNIL